MSLGEKGYVKNILLMQLKREILTRFDIGNFFILAIFINLLDITYIFIMILVIVTKFDG